MFTDSAAESFREIQRQHQAMQDAIKGAFSHYDEIRRSVESLRDAFEQPRIRVDLDLNSKAFEIPKFRGLEGLGTRMVAFENAQRTSVERIFGSVDRWQRWQDKIAREERVASELGNARLLPHWALWPHAACLPTEEETEVPQETMEEFLNRIWPEIRDELERDREACLGDEKLELMHRQMLQVHEDGLHEVTPGVSVPVMERAVNLGRAQGDRRGTMRWLEQEVGRLPLCYVRHDHGFRLWGVLMDNTFANCHSDADADEKKYPNRHAVAHGRGSKLATIIDSLNAVLMAHFVVEVAMAVETYRRDATEWSQAENAARD